MKYFPGVLTLEELRSEEFFLTILECCSGIICVNSFCSLMHIYARWPPTSPLRHLRSLPGNAKNDT